VIVPEPAWPLPAGLPAFRLFVSLWGSLLAVDVARSVDAPGWVAALLVGAVVGLSSLGQSAPAALLVGGIGWLVVTGFVVNNRGDLALSGPADLGRLGALLAVALLGSRMPRLRDALKVTGERGEHDAGRTSQPLAPAGTIAPRHAVER
jgi:hypothetical protein